MENQRSRVRKRVTYALPKMPVEITGNLLLIFARLIPFLPQTHNKLRRLEGRDGPPGRPSWRGLFTRKTDDPASSLPSHLLVPLDAKWYNRAGRVPTRRAWV